ncbi:uncharacterized protein G2W53_010655 [Senna tora]|uniref:Uncharacterized protein n=1 Tax=Senna tora TaxID=362788 RepID=A0A835C9P9_9FABA|nr:uncharacterized protein G2W53_010655 [Senna tora]
MFIRGQGSNGTSPSSSATVSSSSKSMKSSSPQSSFSSIIAPSLSALSNLVMNVSSTPRSPVWIEILTRVHTLGTFPHKRSMRSKLNPSRAKP